MPIPDLVGLIDGRPVPTRDRWLQTTVQPEDATDLADWLEYAIARLEGTPPPVSLRVTAKLEAYARFYRKTATEFASRHASAAARQAPVVGPGHAPPVSEHDEITTAQAADLTGLSDEHWRRMAKDGKIRARQDTRKAWLLSREDVIADTGRRRGRGASDGEGPGPAAGDPG
jgi:excisionase family DNA binding protein